MRITPAVLRFGDIRKSKTSCHSEDAERIPLMGPAPVFFFTLGTGGLVRFHGYSESRPGCSRRTHKLCQRKVECCDS